MQNILPFGEILEAADKLPIRDQESLRDILVLLLEFFLRLNLNFFKMFLMVWGLTS